MLVQVPQLTSSLREPFDVDQAYLQRKLILQNDKPRQSSTSVDESELARKIVHRWEEASYEVRQAYKQFVGAVVELIDGEVHPEEFREVGLAVYRLFGRPEEEDYAEANIAGKKQEVQMHLGHTVSDANMRKIASVAQRLSGMQSSDQSIRIIQLELPISDYVTDLKSVLDQSIRIIQAMIDICANSGWLSSSVTCMHLLQMVMQGLWFDEDSSLWMLPCMNVELADSFCKRGIFRIQQLLDLPKATLQNMIGNFPASKFFQDLQLFPHIEVKLKILRKDGGKSSSLSIKLVKTNFRKYTPHFPKVKNEAWWLVLGNTSTLELYALKRVSFSDHLVTNTELPSDSATLQGMKLILISDCYLGLEQEHSISELNGWQQPE